MKNKFKETVGSSEQKLIKVRLDYNTLITISRMSSLDVWLKRYPEAKVVTS